MPSLREPSMKAEESAVIFDIQRGSAVDGPGLRTTVFFKGCNLRCRWCHNPESWQREPQILVYPGKCTGCGKCARVCPHAMEQCDLCGWCALLCPQDARRLCGRTYTVAEVMEQVEKDRAYYRNTGGGVTFSGGECMLWPGFLTQALRACREAGIHTAVDTAGAVPWERFQQILPYTDLFLYDVKCVTEELHRELTGVSNRLILENLRRLAAQAEVLVRVPVIPGANDRPGELERTAALLRELGLTGTELLPYHQLGEGKYPALGLAYTPFATPTPEQMAAYRRLFA